MRLLHVPLTVAALLYFPFSAHAEISTTPLESTQTESPTITLAHAWQLAEQANPELRQALAQRDAIEGDVTDASSLLWNNPNLTSSAVRRTLPETGSETKREWSAGIEQTFEIAGQQGLRRSASLQQQEAFNASLDFLRMEVRAEVERRFVKVLALQEHIATENTSQQLIANTAAYVQKRITAGEDSRLDGNLANVEAARARNQIDTLKEQLLEARTELASVLQLPFNELPLVQGELSSSTSTGTLEALLASAATQPLVRSLELKELAAKSRLSLERASRYPDVTLGLSTGKEGAVSERERVTTLSITLPLPLFRRNASGIGRASTELTQAQIERQTTNRNTVNNITSLWQKQQSLVARLSSLQQNLLPALNDNQSLSLKSLQAGEIDLFQLLLVNRQELDGRRDLINAQAELRLTDIALKQAAGWNPMSANPRN
ncbi:TolC family protein [Solimicrobium silvestre]|uniref:Outer membrane efflux protein n=1 Tax=Solimicrobium silvestre TaxID=2099400 RepID=A0A2S9H537_9BURK|nr:TolC family protein [Solimicrobium silvestre]PRC95077.1 Outer membrane efflux protein [Solimicrobium silvestre]